jgi:hypothetical protein
MWRVSEHYSDDLPPFDVEALPAATLDDVGRAIGLSKERVRQIERTALQKAKLAMRIGELATPREARRILASLTGASLENIRGAVRELKQLQQESQQERVDTMTTQPKGAEEDEGAQVLSYLQAYSDGYGRLLARGYTLEQIDAVLDRDWSGSAARAQKAGEPCR